MTAAENFVEARHSGKRRIYFLLALLASGTAARLYLAWLTFLNPDEALHYFVAASSSLSAAWKASLTMAHPPLMILLLHLWSNLGSSELFLRLPFVVAGVLFSWFMFAWVKKISGENAGLFALGMSLFLPSLISLTAEIRQYSLLLLFCSACVYWFEIGIEKDSAAWIAASATALCLALLTHYSALIFAAATGIYGVLRLWQMPLRKATIGVWVAGQAVALAICAGLLEIQILPLRRSGVPSEIASTWLRTSIFRSSQDHVFPFALSKTVRLFRYFFSHGTIGVLGLLLFLYGVWVLGRRGGVRSNRAFAVLLALPFLITLATAFGGIYPYGGTRHDMLLVIFAIAGIAIGLDGLIFRAFQIRGRAAKCAALALALLLCNLFPSPSGPAIRPRNQNRKLMSEVMDFLRLQPSDSVLLTDYQSGLVLSYYLCGKHTELPFGNSSEQLLRWRCDDRTVLTSMQSEQGWDLQTLSSTVRQSWNSAPQGQTVWLFRTGWIDDDREKWLSALRTSGCADPRSFGANIRVCQINRPSE